VSGLFLGLFCWHAFRLLSGLVLFKLLPGEWLFFMVLGGILPGLLVWLVGEPIGFMVLVASPRFVGLTVW